MQNFKNIKITYFFVVLMFSVLPAAAYQPTEGNINATLGPYVFDTNYKGSVRSPTMGGVGLLVTGDINPHGALEVDLFHLVKNFYLTHGADTIAESRETLLIGMGYRYWWKPYLSMAITFYSSYGMGDFKVIHDDFAVGDPTQTSAHATTLYGFDFALQAEIWRWERYAVILDGRYSLSVTRKSGERSDDYGGMIGLRYFIQEKEIRQEDKKPDQKI